jgi:hypothetical protein
MQLFFTCSIKRSIFTSVVTLHFWLQLSFLERLMLAKFFGE